jgi:penicillin-binding protein 2
MPVPFDREGPPAPRGGLILLQILILALFCLFIARFWYLQVLRGDYFADLARSNQIRETSISSPRGVIWDRNGVLLAVNEPSFALGLVREDCPDITATLDQVAEWTGLETSTLQEIFLRGKKRVKTFEPLILINDLSFETLAKIESNLVFWPGLEIIVRHKRFYPRGELLAHVLGYVAEANEEELEKDPTLALGDAVGKQGIEYTLENRLRGQKGRKQIQVDALGRELEEQVIVEPKAGNNVTLSIDLGLQEHCAQQLEGQAGAVVVLDPDTGQVLALVSQPSYDNNLFVLGLSANKWQELRDDPMHPIQNRASQSVYPPGSVFKLLMTTAGFATGMLKYTDSVVCTGSYKMGNHEFHCWKKGGHGHIDLRGALVNSCDVFFYQLGERLGVDRINGVATECGLGVPTGIDLPHERAGIVPSTAWKKKRYGVAWTRGETLNTSIGQGYVQLSPLQVARFVGSLVNGGRILKPLLVASDPPLEQGRLPISDKDREFIVSAMVATVDAGTAHKIWRPDARIGGKTGTAQVVKLINADERKKTVDMPYKYRDHSWLASFGQKDGKSYVVVCMVEHGGHAGEAAVPVVKSVYDYLFGPVRTQAPPSKPQPQSETAPPAESD